MLVGSRGNAPQFGIAFPTLEAADVSLPTAATTKTGPLDRIGAFLKSDQGRGALLRSAAATLQGGLGAGIQAGASYVDGQKASAAKQHQQDVENGLATRNQDLAELRARQADDLGWAGVDVNLRQLGETSRHNQAGEQIQVRGQNVDMRGQDVSRANNTENNATSRSNNAADNATSRANNTATVGASIYGTNVGYLADGQRAAAGIGSKGQPYTETRVENPAVPASNAWFGADTPATPKTTTITRSPLLATGPTATPPADAVAALKANPNLRAQFDAKYGAGASSQHLGGR